MESSLNKTLNNIMLSANQPYTLDNHLSQGSVPLYLKILASIFYMISMILGVGGNTFVLLIFLFYQRTKTVTKFFIINLAISDLIFAVLCIPSTYITAYLIQYWPFSGFLCIFLNYMQTVSVTFTVYTLVWLTLDKYWGLVKPLKLRTSITACKFLIAFSWLFSLLVSLPIALFTKLIYQQVYTNSSVESISNSSSSIQFSESTVYEQNSNQNLPQCVEQWPVKIAHLSNAYNLLLLLIQYFIPLIFLTYCYIRIGLVIKKQKAPGESIHSRDAKMTQSRQKLIKMCFLMVLTFMVFWTPLHFLNVYRFYDERIGYSRYFSDLFFVCHILAVSRSFVNPFIYAWTNSKFRKGFVYFSCCYCFGGEHRQQQCSPDELVKMNSFRYKSQQTMDGASRMYYPKNNQKSSSLLLPKSTPVNNLMNSDRGCEISGTHLMYKRPLSCPDTNDYYNSGYKERSSRTKCALQNNMKFI